MVDFAYNSFSNLSTMFPELETTRSKMYFFIDIDKLVCLSPIFMLVLACHCSNELVTKDGDRQ